MWGYPVAEKEKDGPPHLNPCDSLSKLRMVSAGPPEALLPQSLVFACFEADPADAAYSGRELSPPFYVITTAGHVFFIKVSSSRPSGPRPDQCRYGLAGGGEPIPWEDEGSTSPCLS